MLGMSKGKKNTAAESRFPLFLSQTPCPVPSETGWTSEFLKPFESTGYRFVTVRLNGLLLQLFRYNVTKKVVFYWLRKTKHENKKNKAQQWIKHSILTKKKKRAAGVKILEHFWVKYLKTQKIDLVNLVEKKL